MLAITASERAAFKRCRRAWGFSSRLRQNLGPLDAVPAVRDPVLEALAVHYFPGMWAWDREIVAPLVLKAAGEASAFVERYVQWAATVDDFEPLRVEFDFDARIPDPEGDGDLAAPDGRAVHFQGRVNALVVDETRQQWLLVHRIGPWTDTAVLRLDEEAVSAAWAWEQTFLDARVHGVLFNELTVDGQFRRTLVPFSRGAIDEVGRQLAVEAAEMLDASLPLYPTPGADCSICPFVTPCLAMQSGHDAGDLLAAHFRPRPPERLEEGRLGGATWGMGRGAMPVRFGDDDR